MASKPTRQERQDIFIKEARRIHGDRYDYSKVHYTDNMTEVEVICPEHDHQPWFPRPANHIHRKAGCPYCAGKKLNTALFIRKAKEVHGGLYDYSRVEYVDTKTPVVIVCPKHGPWPSNPGDHINSGAGCPTCGVESQRQKRRTPIDQFIAKSKAVWGEDTWDYSKADDYKGSHYLVTLICKKHDLEVPTKAWDHLGGHQSCPKCMGTIRNREDFIEAAIRIHGDKYDYSKVKYEGAHTNVIIGCPDHGLFLQWPASHIHQKAGCSECSGTSNQKVSKKQFIERSREHHGELYSYRKTKLVTVSNKVEIYCRVHRCYYQQSAASHMKGHVGCKQCKAGGFRSDLAAIMYYLRIDRGYNVSPLYKIGITNRTVEKRFKGADLDFITTLRTWSFDTGEEARLAETVVLSKHIESLYFGGPVLKQGGNTELFKRDVLGLDE